MHMQNESISVSLIHCSIVKYTSNWTKAIYKQKLNSKKGLWKSTRASLISLIYSQNFKASLIPGKTDHMNNSQGSTPLKIGSCLPKKKKRIGCFNRLHAFVRDKGRTRAYRWVSKSRNNCVGHWNYIWPIIAYKLISDWVIIATAIFR